MVLKTSYELTYMTYMSPDLLFMKRKMTWHFSPMMFSVPRLDDTSATNIHGQQSTEATSRQHDLAASGGHEAHRSNDKGVTFVGQGTQSAMSLMVHVNVQIPNDQNWNGRNGRVHNSREMISNILISAVKQPNIDQRYNVPGLQWWGYLHSRQVLHSNVVARGRLEWKMHEISCRV